MITMFKKYWNRLQLRFSRKSIIRAEGIRVGCKGLARFWISVTPKQAAEAMSMLAQVKLGSN